MIHLSKKDKAAACEVFRSIVKQFVAHGIKPEQTHQMMQYIDWLQSDSADLTIFCQAECDGEKGLIGFNIKATKVPSIPGIGQRPA